MALVAYPASDDEREGSCGTGERAIQGFEDRSLLKRKRRTDEHGAAPNVSLEDPMQMKMLLLKSTDKELTLNVRYDDLSRPLQGPVNPFNGANTIARNTLTGFAEEQAFTETTFRTQQKTYQKYGYARDPAHLGGSRNIYVGDVELARLQQGSDILDLKQTKSEAKALRMTREPRGDPGVVEGPEAFKGPWAKYMEDKAAEEVEEVDADYEETEEEIALQESTGPLESIYDAEAGEMLEKSEFHAGSPVDYQGRSKIMHVPQDLDINLNNEPGEQECYIPKKVIHTYLGHTKPISTIRFFPRSGHVLLSAGHDTKIKIWDVYHQRELLRTYSGHGKAVRDICFDNTGARFLSASFDRMVKLWDTDTGQCIQRFSTGKIGYAIKFNPEKDKQNEFLVGTSDKKIVQYDIRSGKVVQEYDHHLAAVNTITFVDGNRRFMTTSDDKSLRVWDYGINVPIKLIHEPYMNSLVSVVLHPNQKYVAAQSLDNSVLVYGATDKFRQNNKKGFRGHSCGGYAVQIDFSPDGKYLMSGDSGGYACFWDWKTSKMYKKFKIHEQCLVSIAAHPQETSKVATASWDGTIKLLD